MVNRALSRFLGAGGADLGAHVSRETFDPIYRFISSSDITPSPREQPLLAVEDALFGSSRVGANGGRTAPRTPGPRQNNFYKEQSSEPSGATIASKRPSSRAVQGLYIGRGIKAGARSESGFSSCGG
jgi:hypothetical protein